MWEPHSNRPFSAALAPLTGSWQSTLPTSGAPQSPLPGMGARGLGRCRFALALAVLLDAAGTAALLTGIFARLRLRGRDFGDLLIYSGAVLVFLSLLGWIVWYTGNLEIAPEELARDYGAKGGTLARIARKISRSWSRRQRPRVSGLPRSLADPQPSGSHCVPRSGPVCKDQIGPRVFCIGGVGG
uniref:Transmembrane protein 238 n=1 Tax=Sphenodon punctatus TaxID=8508 RepID=A0A8D0GXE4_SPHPU